MWAHLGALLVDIVTCGILGWVPPLVLMLGKGKTSPFVRHHAGQALGFWIELFVASLVTSFLTIVVIGFLIAPVILVWWLVFAIMASVKASQGEWYKIPANIPLGS